ncbi:GPI-anchored surface protein, putative [Bodo saltans]|uniref:GPI-anchored surface protein, putative n=1 Tax=Bodo saltans TaxID=75058 RepID=A0A0S4IR69_BODSA|nr:GPI-anchored surface protein, putative [Bodo saltans]|eukprot:CUG00714.1 GPI-anchored surface protein, putative [Bodo saltans]
MIVFASGFAIALIQAPFNKEYQTSSAPIPSCIATLTHEQIVELIDAVGSTLNALSASNVAASQRVTEAYGMLLNTLLDFSLALLEGVDANSEARLQLLTSVKQVMFTACSKFRGSYTAFPMTSLLSIRTASAVCKSVISNKKSRLSIIGLPLLVKASVMENKCHDKKHQSHLDWALADNLCRVCAFSLVNRATRTVIYYRGDDIRLAQAEITNHSEYAAHSFAVSAPIDCPHQTSSVAQDMARRWLESLPCLYKAFVSDAGWTLMAREQRRLKIQRDAIRHQEKPKKAKQSTLNQLSMDSRSRSSANGDADHMSSRGSTLSMGSTIVSIIKAREAGGTNDELLSVLDTVDAETRSVLSSMSHASATSYLSFMSVIDAAGAERDELQRHESADHNTNLALIFFEQIVLAISQLVESIDLATLTSTGLVDVAWKQIEKLFVTLQASLSPVDGALVASMPLAYRRALISLENTPLFQFSHDMRYNGGLGYQTLGILFARVMSPLLDTEAESVPLIPTSAAGNVRAGTRWSQLRTPQQESALAACLGVYEAVAPQVINMHLKQIVRVVASSLNQADKQVERARMLEVFLSRIILRLGKSNSALSLLNILLQIAVAAPLDEAQRTLRLVRQPLLDRSISQSVEDCMDIESMLAFLGRAVDLLQVEDDEVKTDDEEQQQVEGPVKHEDRAALALQLLSCVGRGLLPTSLTSFIVVDRIAEVDLILSNYIASIATGNPLTNATKRLIADSLKSLFSVRQVMDRCLVDLGASDMEQYLRVLEGSLWQFETSVPQLAGTLTLQEDLAAVEGVTDGPRLVSALALQRLTQCHSVVTVLDLMAAVRRDLRHLAVFVLEQFSKSGPSSQAMLQLTQSQWTALSCYGKKALIRTFVPVLRQQCVTGLNVEAFLGEWSSSAGDVLDALTVMLLEATSASKELSVLLTAMSLLVRGRATVPRLPQVLSALGALFVDLGDSDVNKSALVADLLLLLLQCSHVATMLVLRGSKAPQLDSLRPAYIEYLADPDELLEEAKDAGAQLPKLVFSPVVGKLLLSASGKSSAHARLLSLLYTLGGSLDPATSKYVPLFSQTIVAELLLLVQNDSLDALAQFLSLQQPSTAGKKRQRQEGSSDAATAVEAPFSPITSALFKALEQASQQCSKNAKNVGLVLRCLRLLILLGPAATSIALTKDQCQTLIASSHAIEIFANNGADGVIVALALSSACAG